VGNGEAPHSVLESMCFPLNLMLKDVGKISLIKEVIDRATSITKFIYNYAFVLSLIKKFTRNRELSHPTITHFVNTSFLFNLCSNVIFSRSKYLFVMTSMIMHFAQDKMGEPPLNYCTLIPSRKEWRKCA
jgi:hypothetical protein